MKPEAELFPIGYFLKLHGYKGEIETVADYDEIPLAGRWVMVDRDGLKVPFHVDSCRPKGSNLLVKLRGVDSDREAKPLIRKEIFIPREEVPEGIEAGEGDEFYLSDLVGFTAYDGPTLLGTIEDYDDTTDNTLFNIRRADGHEFLIPAAPDLIESFDSDLRTVTFNLPEGLADLSL